MKPAEVFALAVRIAGLVSLLYVLATGVMLFGAGMPLFLVVKSVIWLLISLWLLRGAPQLVRFAYPHSE